MSALDSRVALALMAKAERVFGQAGQVLAFQVGGSAYTAEQLNFFPEHPDAERVRLVSQSLSGFSSFANTIADSQVWLAASGRLDLPAVYRRMLEQAKIASLPEDPRDVQALARARAILYAPTPAGIDVDTPMHVAYKECRDRFLLASQQFEAARISGELSTDPADKAAWQQTGQILGAARDQAMAEWDVRGQRAKVEDALAQIAQFTPRTPASTWADWELRSRKGIGTLLDLANMPYWPVYISPANACEAGWQTMTLTSGEVASLQQAAPEDIRQRIGEGQAALQIDRLEFQYTSAKLHRPWFDPAAFASRFWRPNQASFTVSSGEKPYAGDCPLYASGVVFVRRIRAFLKQDADAANTALQGLGNKFNFGLFELSREQLRVASPVAEATAIAATAAATVVTPMRRTLGLRRRGARMRGEFGGVDRMGATADITHVAMPVPPPPPPPPPAKFNVRGLLDKRAVMRDALTEVVVAPPAPAKPSVPVLETSLDDIFVLAVICSIVPASPNPDPALAWD